ncbi:hypothetical protein HWI79_16 [Cryptosporidium felis]|nr:hypothetical protein HWI79_16 [Cryptosporidium felis]
MKSFYVLPLRGSDAIPELGTRIFESIAGCGSWDPGPIALNCVYMADLDTEEFRQNVLSSVTRQLLMFDPIRFEGVCYLYDATYKRFSSLWRISKSLCSIFVMVLDEGTFTLRGKLVLDFVVDWCERLLQSGKELGADDILVVLHILAPAGNLQILNDDILSKIELMFSHCISSN